MKALPKMESAANAPRLKQAFADHLEETREQVERLKEVFMLIGSDAKPKPCKGMASLLEEGDEVIEDGEQKDAASSDLALIASAQKVEHYEISAYGQTGDAAAAHSEERVVQMQRPVTSEQRKGKTTTKAGKSKN